MSLIKDAAQFVWNNNRMAMRSIANPLQTAGNVLNSVADGHPLDAAKAAGRGVVNQGKIQVDYLHDQWHTIVGP